MSQVKEVKLPPRDKWPEGATHYEDVGDRSDHTSGFLRVVGGKVIEAWSVRDDFSVEHHHKNGWLPMFDIANTVELPADPVIDWSAAPEGFPLWVQDLRPKSRDCSAWAADEKTAYRLYQCPWMLHWAKVAEDAEYLVYRKPEQVTSQPAEAPVIDWAKGPADATHWGAKATVGASDYMEAFYKFDSSETWFSIEVYDWAWRLYCGDISFDRYAMLIERPKAEPAPVIEQSQPIVIKAVNSTEDAFDALHEAFESGETLTVAGRSFRFVMVGRDFDGVGTKCVRADIQQFVQAAWSGEGVPPPMTPVEFKSVDGDWMPGIYIGKVYGRLLVGCDQTRAVGSLSSEEMRPVRTPEQIAADERLHKIRNASTHIAEFLATLHESEELTAVGVLEAMIDAGYAKQVAP